jgi:DNA-binding NarL/FixJ family response regulator
LTDQTFDEAKELAQRSLAAVTHWHESEFPEPHRTAIYTRHEILERLSIVQNASEAKTEGRGYLALNLYRFRSKGHLASREIESTQREAKTLMACVRKHIEICSMHVGRRSPGAALKDACPALTERELQVCVRLIRGLTYEGIGADLGLSLASVKTYRARAYERLGIHFKSQLLSVAGILD